MDPLGYGVSRPPERELVIEPDHFLKMDALDGYALMQALSFKKFSIFGYCNGGVSANILAALHPESVQNLVIWGSTAYYVTKHDVEIWKKIRGINNVNQEMREAWENIYGDSMQNLWSRWIDSMKDTYEKRKDHGDLCMEEIKRVQCSTRGKGRNVPAISC